jgi:hypothetical protein
LGIDLQKAQLLMDLKANQFPVEGFLARVVERLQEPEVTPTVLLVPLCCGVGVEAAFVFGGFAGVPWPKDESSRRGIRRRGASSRSN